MTRYSKLVAYFSGTVATAILGAVSLGVAPAAAAPCQGPGAPPTAQTKCIAVMTTGHPLTSYDISFVNPNRAEYYLGDRSTSGVDIFDTQHLTFKRTISGFKGIVLNAAGTAVDNAHSGPAGVASHGRWVYGGDGDSTLKVIDLDSPTATAIKQVISTKGTARVDEMALTTDGKLLIAANNADDPPFATLFAANGDDATSHTTILLRITVDPTIIVPGFGQSLEQPAWDPKTQRFYTSIPWIANNPPGCNANSNAPITCDGGLLVTDPRHPTAVQGKFDPATNTGVIALTACGPNGATVGVHDNILLGCTPNNNANNKTTLVINAKTHNTANVNGITGS